MDTSPAATPTMLTAELPKDGLCRILSLDGGGAKGFYTLSVLNGLHYLESLGDHEYVVGLIEQSYQNVL